MSARLGFEIPATVTTRFLVAAADRDVPDVAALRDDLGGSALADAARELAGSPLLLVSGGPAAGSQWRHRPAHLGGSQEELRLLGLARRHLVVTSTVPPPAQPRPAQAARLVARALAAETFGIVADLAANQVVPHGNLPAAEQDAFVLGDDWIGVFVAPEGGRYIRTDTAGLHRFALPELSARRVPYGLMLTAINTLRALAFRLVGEHLAWLSAHPGAAHREIDAVQPLGADDLLGFWGVRPVGGDRTPVRLKSAFAACPECDGAIEVVPPGDRAAPDWWERDAARVIPAVTSATDAPGPVPVPVAATTP